ncbi:MAG: hypothetical protein PHN56_05180 [Candidatus Nanoarchaeia archaeon]|nr:hypothetical protein [Candidatus Nanoarchaeia archaeon]
MIAFIIYEVFNLKANLLLFLFCSILPDASWPFYKKHRIQSWYHTVLTFFWTIFFHPYWIAVLSHFIADFFTGGIRFTPFDKKTFGIKLKNEERKSENDFFLIRLIKHVFYSFKSRKLLILIEVILFVICMILIFL